MRPIRQSGSKRKWRRKSLVEQLGQQKTPPMGGTMHPEVQQWISGGGIRSGGKSPSTYFPTWEPYKGYWNRRNRKARY